MAHLKSVWKQSLHRSLMQQSRHWRSVLEEVTSGEMAQEECGL